MKKLVVLALSAALACFICSCGGGSQSSHVSDLTRFDSIPAEIPYMDTTISLSALSFCEVYTNHSYAGFCIATVDRDNLTDDDVYWMLKREGAQDAEIYVNAYLTSEANSLDSERMSPMPVQYDDEHIYFCFCSNIYESYRYHLDDFEITLQIVMLPERSLTADSTHYYYYDIEAEEGVDYSDLDNNLTEDEAKFLNEALQDELDNLNSIHGLQ